MTPRGPDADTRDTGSSGNDARTSLLDALPGWAARDVGPRFGLFLGQAGKAWTEVAEQFELADELGFDHAWLVDHLLPTDGPPDDDCMEAWTVLAGLAVRTRRIRLGILVSSGTFRHPSLLLKEAATVDQLSGGRLILGLGTGWYEDEHRRYGIPFPPATERVARLEETVRIAHLLMTRERTTFDGDYYQLVDAPLAPGPLQRPRIPVLIAAHRPRMLRVAARYADMWDTFAETPGTATEGVRAGIADRIARLDMECRRIGRDPGELRRSTWTGGEAMSSDEAYIGFVERHAALGFTDFTTGFPSRESARARHVAREIVPELRERLGRALSAQP